MTDVAGAESPFVQSGPDPGSWEPFLVGDVPVGEVHYLRQSGSDGSPLVVAFWRSQPQTFSYTFEGDETLYLIHGRVEVEYPDGAVVEIRPGDVVSFNQGATTTWRILEYSQKLFVVAN
ncbi:cupin domain-containing protein [Nocardia sp. CA-135953]|uniref:cupin domain-containing protein n=1 Tax=Nocardia sp. CA-135953 TaxID=3239978 RepID=UPI003D9674C7